MTARDIYDAVGIELNKVKAPNILLEDFNYMLNKAISLITNKFYNSYDISQLTTDDMRVLKSSATLTPTKIGNSDGLDLYGASYELYLPPDYFHILNVVCKFIPTKNFKCYKANTPVYFGARRLVADSWPVIINNLYNRPSYKMPYYYLHNVNKLTTNLISNNSYEPKEAISLGTGTDDSLARSMTVNGTSKALYIGIPKGCTTAINLLAVNGGITGNSITLSFVTDTQLSTLITTWNNANAENKVVLISGDAKQIPTENIVLSGGSATKSISLVNSEKEATYRYGNASSIRMEIRYGKDSSIFTLSDVHVDYLKSPQFVVLTEEEIDSTMDTSQLMEFPDYVNFEIINTLVAIILENTSNPRINSNIPLSQTIAPAQLQIQMQQAKEQIKNM